MKRSLLPLALFLGLLALLGVGLRLDPAVLPSPLVGKPAPAFQLALLHDPARTLSNRDMAGQVWLLNVWASWCTACGDEHPALMRLAASGAVPVVGLNYKDERGAGLAWLERHGNPYAASAFDADGATGIDFGVYGVPETFVIDRRGMIRLKHVGVLTPRVIEETLLPLVRELQRGQGDA